MKYSIASIGKGFPKKSLYINLRLNLMAVSVGIVGGFGAVLFRWLYYSINNLSFWHKLSIYFVSPVSNGLGYLVIIPPAMGGLIVGFITYYYATEAKGHGVPEVMEAMYASTEKIKSLLKKTFSLIPGERKCPCRDALKESKI